MADEPLPGLPPAPPPGPVTVPAPTPTFDAHEPVSVELRHRDIVMHPVMDEELTTLRGVGPNVQSLSSELQSARFSPAGARSKPRT